MHQRTLENFIMESNAIEGINRTATEEEYKEACRFLALERIELDDMIKFVKVYQPNAELRHKVGLNVRIGKHMPPAGGHRIALSLCSILSDASEFRHTSYKIHVRYELLHPFTDCNGRSGRILWLWMIHKLTGDLPKLSFLHSWYYSSLDATRQ